MENVNQIALAYNTLAMASNHGLEAEVFISALKAIKENPELSIEDAMVVGYQEWIKQ
jgi:hypothetical protein